MPTRRPHHRLPPDEQCLELLVDTLAFAFVTTCVQELGSRPSPHAIEQYRQRVTEALRRAGADLGSDEPTEPREPRTGPHRR